MKEDAALELMEWTKQAFPEININAVWTTTRNELQLNMELR